MLYDDTLQIRTDRLLLRRFSPSDIPDMLKNWISDPDVQSGYGEPVYLTAESAAELLRRWQGQYRWAIVLRDTGENIGHVSFCRLYENVLTGEIEYCIGKIIGKGHRGGGRLGFSSPYVFEYAAHKNRGVLPGRKRGFRPRPAKGRIPPCGKRPAVCASPLRARGGSLLRRHKSGVSAEIGFLNRLRA